MNHIECEGKLFFVVVVVVDSYFLWLKTLEAWIGCWRRSQEDLVGVKMFWSSLLSTLGLRSTSSGERVDNLHSP